MSAMHDPFASIAQPMQQTPAIPSAGPQDPFAAIATPAGGSSPSQTPPASPGVNGGLGAWVERNIKGTPQEQEQGWGSDTAAGFVKSAGRMAATVLDLITPNFVEAYKKQYPNATDAEAQAAVKAGTPAIMKHVQDAAQWLKTGSQPEGFLEHVGAIGEQVIEFLGTEGLLKLVGGGAQAANTAAKGVKAAEQLKGAQQVAQTLSSNPKLAGLVAIGLKASQDASLMAAQTYLHTEDPTQAAIGGAFGAGGRVLAEGAGAAGRYLLEHAPRRVQIAGEEIPALASQVNEHGEPNDTGAIGAPKIAEQQQTGAVAVIRNLAQRALAGTLGRINETRPAFPVADSSRLLEAPEGAEPFTFSLKGTPAEEGTEGPLFQSPRKKQIGTRVVERAEGPAPQGGQRPTAAGSSVREINPETGTGPELPEGQAVSTNARRLVKEPKFQYLSGSRPGSPEPRADVATGGGTLQTTDPAEAESWLKQIEDIQESPLHDKLSDAQQAQLEEQRQSLEHQLGIFHASPYAQRFEQIDVAGTVGRTRTFGDAANQIQAAVKPVYQTLDRASGGEFNKWNNAAKQAKQIMRRATSSEAYEQAEQRLEEANRNISDLIDRHRGQVSMQDYIAAKAAWRDSARLDQLHTVMERMTNGITSEESDTGLSRIMTGRTRALEAFLEKGVNRSELERIIGAEGVRNLKQLTQLLAKANTARSTADVLRNVVHQLHAHITTGGTASIIGGTLAHFMGRPWFEGALTGATLTEGMRWVLRDAAVNPRIGNMIEFAARNGVSPKQYAPLIARVLAEPTQETEPEEEEQK